MYGTELGSRGTRGQQRYRWRGGAFAQLAAAIAEKDGLLDGTDPEN
jgi:hypothetical protein